MIATQVKKTMSKALLSFAAKEEKQPNEIAFFIHTKPSEQDPTLTPKYFYSIDGVPVKDGDKIKDLRFTQDILGKKFDLLNQEMLASQFLSGYFKNTSEEIQADPKSLYVMITSQDDKAKDLLVALYKGSEVIRNLELEDLFGE